MLFTSAAFIICVMAVILLYYLLPAVCRTYVLLAAGVVFYCFSGVTNLLYLAAAAAVTFIFAILIENRREASSAYMKEHKAELSAEARKSLKKKNAGKLKRLLLIGLLLDLGMLAVVKYTDFVIYNVNGALRLFGGTELSFLNIALPMGISFYVFQSLSYLIDVYRGKTKAQRDPFKYALFVSFFPQLVQGPISRYDDMAESLYNRDPFSSDKFFRGFECFIYGFFKKLVIADRLLGGVKEITANPENYTGGWVFLGMVLYAAELYCDFTGGIDITISIAEMLGIKLKENFDRPYFSKSLKEFWNRWHITMGTWFTDYIFYPVSVSPWMLKLSRWSRKHLGDTVGKRVPVYVSCILVWTATGIWHGASWNFVVWGLLNCVVLLVSQELDPLYTAAYKKLPFLKSRPWDVVKIIRTMFIVASLRILDCYRDVPLSFRMFFGMFTKGRWGEMLKGWSTLPGLTVADAVVAGCGIVLVFVVSLLGRHEDVRDRLKKRHFALRFALYYLLFMAVIIFGAYGIGYDQAQFIYNQF